MKKSIFILTTILSLTFINCSKNDNDQNVSNPYISVQKKLDNGQTPISLYNNGTKIDSLYGKKYKGGYIFYLNTSNGTGLLAHNQDNSSSVNWGSLANVSGANDTTLGSGLQNTNAILSYYSQNNTAADIANDLVIENFSDWYLPSKDEMLLMINRLKNKPNIYFGASSGYWTSSNYDFNNVWMVRTNETSIQILKYDALLTYDIRVRAIRSF